MSSIPGGRPPDELPVLTDVIVPGHIPIPLNASGNAGGSTDPTRATGQWDAVEAQVTEAVLKGLQGRIEGMIDQRLGDTVGLLLQEALGGLSAELKLRLRETLRDVVQRAVAQEISRLRSEKP